MALKESLKKLEPYRPPKRRPAVKLDANESDNFLFFDGPDLKDVPLNLYPDSQAMALKERLAEVHGLPVESILVGSGSSELIELTIKTFMNPGETVLSVRPTFGLYEIYTTIHGGRYETVPLNASYDIDMDVLIEKSRQLDPAIIILCTPNNPTGRRIAQKDIERLLRRTEAVVLLDEAYIDFSGEDASLKRSILDHPNLLVARTFSKAYGMAGARLGYMFAPLALVEPLNAVKTPYSVNALSQALGVKALKDTGKVVAHCEAVARRRDALRGELRALGLAVPDSEANFLYVQSEDDRLKEKLVEYDIAIRAYQGTTPASYRISIGSEEENRMLIDALKEVLQ